MDNLSIGWCSVCANYEDSSTKGIFVKRFTGNCARCGTRLKVRNLVKEAAETSAYNRIVEDLTPFYSIPFESHTSHHKTDHFHGDGGSFGGGGASSSWDSSSSSSYDSGSSSSDSGSSSSD